MYFIGQERYIEFRMYDLQENPVTGLLLSNFTVIFTRNASSCSDTLTLVENGGGLYTLNYTPSTIGHDYIDMYNSTYDIRIQDSDDIYQVDIFVSGGSGAGIYTVTQNTGGSNALQLTVSNPQNYVIYAFLSSNWIVGQNTANYAYGSTTTDTSGNWLESISLPAGTYHIVALWNTNQIVLAAYLTLG
jgi:hypothetical protein